MPLSSKHIHSICLYGNGGRQCRYLDDDELDSTNFHCLKLSNKDKIDKNIKTWIKTEKDKGKDPLAQGHPLGDNCDGYPILRHLIQGFDQD